MTTTTAPLVAFSARIRKSPFFDATLRWGAKAFSTYNHMYMPLYYETPVADYWKLVEAVTLWDVAVERQVEIAGPDAARFAQYLTPRDLSETKVGQCKYALICDEHGGIINDPVLLKLAEDRFWFSLADSDVLLWAKGLAIAGGWNVEVREPDVSPLQVQGPKSPEVMASLFGDWIQELKYFWFRETELDGIPLVVSRTGWSTELGYELFLRDGSRGDELWERIMAAAGIEVGGVEYLIDDRDGTLRYYDVNALSNFVADGRRVIGFDPFERLVDWLEAELTSVDPAGRRRATRSPGTDASLAEVV